MSITSRVKDYFREVVAEAKKVSWPSRKEVQAATTVVMVMVAILSVFIFAIDQVFIRLLGLLFGGAGS